MTFDEALSPTPTLIAKLASIVVHAEELLGPTGHQLDKNALIAVWDGKSKGTRHMIEVMKGLKKPLYIHYVHPKTR